MNGTRISITRLTGLLFAAAVLCAAAPDYFPLQVGNSWAYRVTQGRTSRAGTINVEARETIEGRDYFRVNFFENTVYLRQVESGSILVYNKETKQEGLWLPLGSAQGQTVQTEIDPCSRSATIESTAARLKTTLGEFDNALQIRYTVTCADAGITQQYFLPYVGMVFYETSSIAGPVRHELVYSRTGATNLDVQTNAFTVATDAPTYKVGQTTDMLVRVTLRVTQPIVLTFPSGQNGDLRITNERGENVYTWSADKLFAMIFREERLEPGERTWLMEAPITNLPRGRYQVEAWLATQPRQYSGVVSFEIVP
jgi:hypothetical protein